MKSNSGLDNAIKHTDAEKNVNSEICRLFQKSIVPLPQRLRDFARHTKRQDLARFLAKYELFKQIISVNGNVIECGVYAGGGLAAWLHFSSILEPYNHTRRIIGFDTFAGFPAIHEKDKTGTSEHLRKGGFVINASIKDELTRFFQIHDQNRPLGHIPKVELVAGDACKTIPNYLRRNPHTLIALLYLDFDIYKPTKAALTHLYSRVCRGGMVAFDELNCPEFPGETAALMESLDLGQVRLRRFPFDPYISYFIKEP